ncbi:hypothetical protein ACFWWC_27220 [Streptomyces sp. NPDC058642]|uniref:hypothetical protein n=1 Tax=Streptomyces sp. NPDC058642 TaxID=3346572 RepID=UPI0036543392
MIAGVGRMDPAVLGVADTPGAGVVDKPVRLTFTWTPSKPYAWATANSPGNSATRHRPPS